MQRKLKLQKVEIHQFLNFKEKIHSELFETKDSPRQQIVLPASSQIFLGKTLAANELKTPVDQNVQLKTNDRTQKITDTTPRVADKTPKVADTATPRVADKTPKVADTATPRVADKTPKVADTATPRVTDKTPRVADTATPRVADKTPKVADTATPRVADKTPKVADTATPRVADKTPKVADTATPRVADKTPKVADTATPRVADKTPKVADTATPRVADKTPKVADTATPRVTDKTPRVADTATPRVTDKTPKVADTATPRVADTATPRVTDKTPKAANKTPNVSSNKLIVESKTKSEPEAKQETETDYEQNPTVVQSQVVQEEDGDLKLEDDEEEDNADHLLIEKVPSEPSRGANPILSPVPTSSRSNKNGGVPILPMADQSILQNMSKIYKSELPQKEIQPELTPKQALKPNLVSSKLQLKEEEQQVPSDLLLPASPASTQLAKTIKTVTLADKSDPELPQQDISQSQDTEIEPNNINVQADALPSDTDDVPMVEHLTTPLARNIKKLTNNQIEIAEDNDEAQENSQVDNANEDQLNVESEDKIVNGQQAKSAELPSDTPRVTKERSKEDVVSPVNDRISERPHLFQFEVADEDMQPHDEYEPDEDQYSYTAEEMPVKRGSTVGIASSALKKTLPVVKEVTPKRGSVSGRNSTSSLLRGPASTTSKPVSRISTKPAIPRRPIGGSTLQASGSKTSLGARPRVTSGVLSRENSFTSSTSKVSAPPKRSIPTTTVVRLPGSNSLAKPSLLGSPKKPSVIGSPTKSFSQRPSVPVQPRATSPKPAIPKMPSPVKPATKPPTKSIQSTGMRSMVGSLTRPSGRK